VTPLDYADIQGTILRGYRVDRARHFVLRVVDPTGAKEFVSSLVDPASGLPQITTAARWTVKPTSFLNIGITAAGLVALGQPVDGFPQAFQRGATDPLTAKLVGDVGASQPSAWIEGFADGRNVHVILSLWVNGDSRLLDGGSEVLRRAFGPALEELGAADATALPDNKVHFGYTDNISQPTVAGAPPRKRPLPDQQPVAPTGEFLLGYPNQNGGATYKVTPEVLSKNSSFAAFRLLEQDVAGFEAWLATAAGQAGIDAELLAAKACGRWRSGVPLVLSPDTGTPDPPLPPDRINDYDYVSDDSSVDDTFGYRCPVGAHMRRTNPRGEKVTAGGSMHRIVRRAMPYGPAYDPTTPHQVGDGEQQSHSHRLEPCGLVGWFINADLANQFELIMGQWVNGSTFVQSVRGPGGANPVLNITGQDVILGVNPPATSSFTLSYPPGVDTKWHNQALTGFGPFVTTRGGAYCYLPSITALRAIAAA
jgi:deferrochelatase/peroxidase EfeB